jgi:SAM-dependent methyltransferase
MGVIEELGPWMYEFEFEDGTRTPLAYEAVRGVHAVRHSMLTAFLDAVRFDPTASVLDLACSEGFFALELAKRGARDVLGIDARERTIQKAEYVRDRYGITNCRFEVGDITEAELGVGSFDIVLLLGVIYHVEDPIRLMRRAAAAAKRLLILETQLTKYNAPMPYGWGSVATLETEDSWAMVREDPNANELSSTRGFSLIPNASAVVSTLRDIGFSSILQMHPNRAVGERQYELVHRAMYAALW